MNSVVGTTLRDYYRLTKPTITLLVVITALPAIFMAAGKIPPMALISTILIGTAFVSASAAVFNQLVEVGIDSRMARTRTRSMPSGKVSAIQGSLFGITLGVA